MKQNQYNRLTSVIKLLMIGMIFILLSSTIILAVETTGDSNCLTPTENQYLELRAVSVNDVVDQNKQVMMELWGHNIEFKRV